jgi:hypothetical protein
MLNDYDPNKVMLLQSSRFSPLNRLESLDVDVIFDFCALQNHLLCRGAIDKELTVIHHYSDEKLAYPLLKFGVVLSIVLARR